MLERLVPNDCALSQSRFRLDEARYNLIHLISGQQENAYGFKSPDGNMIYAQTHGNAAWLWISGDVPGERRSILMKELAHRIQGTALPGITGDPQTAEEFAAVYSQANALSYRTNMMMEAYVCPQVKKPEGVIGLLRPAASQDVNIVAEFKAGFSEEALGAAVDPASLRSAAEQIIAGGGLYLWLVEGKPVSMANIAHRSPRHARINAVYTPPAERYKGYASAIVAELCAIAMKEGLEPMLYADLNNPVSNRVYKNIGFVESGTVKAIRFM
ncbi:GNAT family N-acetyltransferase [Paenibacillus spongiae]|uniref:GNAT family N-acetyltransferase n=1 Tax=Paenibacillus spongiae TaxID=2909671 RepID=A0ABY5S8V5_9BACL|nr:GNAT family N-acetyltransferase [Paenibacillus spongiae]UVI30119.1 GNAT family N-acetyltransferase [Paenibacillus spongiae]